MTSQKDAWSEVTAIISECHARIERSGADRTSVKVEIYDELKAKGLDQAAEMLMFYDAVVRANMPSEPHTIFNFNNAQIANANFGTQIGSINASLEAVISRDFESAKFADALKQLTEAVVNTPELNDNQKREVLEALAFVGQQAEEPTAKRKPGVLKPVLESIPKLLSSGSALVSLWHTFGPHIIKFFGL